MTCKGLSGGEALVNLPPVWYDREKLCGKGVLLCFKS